MPYLLSLFLAEVSTHLVWIPTAPTIYLQQYCLQASMCETLMKH